jgi:uncharacterized protein YprB with RNaseH-like and TPR domain
VEGLRRKLRKERARPRDQSPQAIIYRRDLPVSEPTPARPRLLPGQHVVLEQAVPGVEVTVPGGGNAFLVENRLDELDGGWGQLSRLFSRRFERAGSRLARRLRELAQNEDLRLEHLLFLDLETTGLSCTPLFLIGTMAWEQGGFVVRQYFARDYAEEAAITSLFLKSLSGKRLLASFNGKSFDLPYLQTRAAANAISCRVALPHFDLLHECRRAWRGILPDCRLQTLERHVCRRTRFSDLPGSEIPDAYHAFVRTRNAAEMIEVLKHNMLDLATLADLMLRLPG